MWVLPHKHISLDNEDEQLRGCFERSLAEPIVQIRATTVGPTMTAPCPCLCPTGSDAPKPGTRASETEHKPKPNTEQQTRQTGRRRGGNQITHKGIENHTNDYEHAVRQRLAWHGHMQPTVALAALYPSCMPKPSDNLNLLRKSDVSSDCFLAYIQSYHIETAAET